MTRPEKLIASVLEEIAMGAEAPKPLADIAWRAGRRRRLTGLAVTASAGVVAIVVAAVLPGLAGQSAPNNVLKIHASAAPITLRTVIQFRQIAVIEGPVPCPPDSPDYVFGDTIPACFRLASPGMTITRVMSIRIIDGPTSHSVAIRLVPGQVGRLAALTTFVSHQPGPRNRLAVLVDGKVVSDPTVESPLRNGDVLIVVKTHAEAERILRELVESR